MAKKYGRTEKSWEYRMQNISYVFSIHGRRWITGLRPAKNVGARVAGKIENLINDIEGQYLPKVAEFELNIENNQKRKSTSKPKGNRIPSRNNSEVTQFSRDPNVAAWVLSTANGICEACDNEAPFVKLDSTPFLEIHHLKRLADDGSDTISNAVAVCPNCHRELHYGKEKFNILSKIYSKLERTIPE